MKKKLVWWLLALALFACTDEDVGVNIAPERNAGFSVSPYPVITINANKEVVLVVTPEGPADYVKISGYFSSSPEQTVWEKTLRDTLSSMDLIPGDGVFRVVVPSTDFTPGGGFALKTRAYLSGKMFWEDSLGGMEIISGNEPVITSLQVSDSLTHDESTWDWRITASDADGGDSLFVEIEIVLSGGALPLGRWKYDEQQGNDPFYLTGSFDNATRAGITGLTEFRFRVTDLAGLEDTVTTQIWVENRAPSILEINFPDTLIADDEVSSSLYLVHVDDPETLADIDSVVLMIYRPDGSGVSSNPYTDFHDDGKDEDLVAGDGWYFIRLGDPSSTSPTGEWTFRVYVTDKAGNKSAEIDHPLIVKEP